MRNHHLSKILLGAFIILLAGQSAYGQNPPQTPEPQKQDPTIKINSTYVTLPVVVTDRFGRFATGLNKQNFAVREDGKAQKVDDFSAMESPFSVVLLIDTSRSTIRKLTAIQKAAETFIKQLQPRDRVMVVTFDDRINVISDFTGDVSTLRKAIKAAKPGYSTRLYDAINFAIKEKLDKVQGRKAIVVLTDGVDTASKQATFDSTVNLIAGSGVISYAIQYETRNDGASPLAPILLPKGSSFLSRPATGSQTKFALSSAPLQFGKSLNGASFLPAENGDFALLQSAVINSQQPQPKRDRVLTATEYLRTITIVSGARHLHAEGIENTSYVLGIIADELRHLYTLGYYSSNEQRDGQYRRITVSVEPSFMSVRTRDGYRAPKDEADKAEPDSTTGKPPAPVKP
jgi:Ca-activated chloride channel homolog